MPLEEKRKTKTKSKIMEAVEKNKHKIDLKQEKKNLSVEKINKSEIRDLVLEKTEKAVLLEKNRK